MAKAKANKVIIMSPQEARHYLNAQGIINLVELAARVTIDEGRGQAQPQRLNVGDVSEVIRLTLSDLARFPDELVIKTLNQLRDAQQPRSVTQELAEALSMIAKNDEYELLTVADRARVNAALARARQEGYINGKI